jgi:glycosyltransferase involved in cell wall biosynthesis
MKITFYSNYLNHLQTSFCDQMYKQLGDDFVFVSTEKLPIDRLSSGYQDCSHYPYNLNSYESEVNYSKALELGIDSDIVIIGSAPEIFVKERIIKNSHTFRYSERILKQRWRLFDLRLIWALFFRHTQHRNKNVYMLCASAFTANDLNLLSAYPNKRFKWGYFTNVELLNIEKLIEQKTKDQIEIIWTGRFLDWKHPELAVQLAYELKKKGYSFKLKMIGAGEQVDSIQNLIKKLNVSDCVSFLGSMSNNEVRSLMQKSNIFIFTSDRNEGWGAVLNEAMSNGCAVIASNTIGSVPYLIEHKKNGLVFKSERLSSLLKQTEILIKDSTLRNKLSANAYHTMENEWNPVNAATKFLLLSKSILEGNKMFFEKGPCSKADKTKINFWND